MGLDWLPMDKPKPGFEERFKQLFQLFEGPRSLFYTDKGEPQSLFDKLKSLFNKNKKVKSRKELQQEWLNISEKSYETIKAPRVGRDKIANDWIKGAFNYRINKRLSEEEFVKENEGYYVIELAKELDGIPPYISLGQDRNAFPGRFLEYCEDLIGEDLYLESWGSKFADEALHYGQRLMIIADKVASENNMLYLKEQYDAPPPDKDEHSLEAKIHVLYAAAKWLIFYGKNGHGFIADF